eukprot:10718667-Alexandrium_andersonii.AAC.1
MPSRDTLLYADVRAKETCRDKRGKGTEDAKCPCSRPYHCACGVSGSLDRDIQGRRYNTRGQDPFHAAVRAAMHVP